MAEKKLHPWELLVNEGNDFMELGKALEIVHEMARCYADDGGNPIPERQLALDTVEDFIVNNFEEEE